MGYMPRGPDEEPFVPSGDRPDVDTSGVVDGLNLWRLCDELSIIQAALLVAGRDPSDNSQHVERWLPHRRPGGYEAAKMAITNALRREKIKGHLTPQFEADREAKQGEAIDLAKSTVEVESLKHWLGSKGFKTGFFFPKATQARIISILRTHDMRPN